MEQKDIEMVKNHLHDGPVIVTFTKTNGEERVMKCTTCMADIPAEHQPSGESKRKFSDEAQRVFDLDKQEWRSFRWDSVISVELV